MPRDQCRQAGDGAGGACCRRELAQCPGSGFDDGVVGVVGGDEEGCSLYREVGGGVVRNAPVRCGGGAASGSIVVGVNSGSWHSVGGTSLVGGGRAAGSIVVVGCGAMGGSIVVGVSSGSCVASGDRGAAAPDAGIRVGQGSGERSGVPSAEPSERAEGRGAYRGIWIEAALGGSVLVAEMPGDGGVLPPGCRAVTCSALRLAAWPVTTGMLRLGARSVPRGALRLGARPVTRGLLIRGRLCGARAG